MSRRLREMKNACVNHSFLALVLNLMESQIDNADMSVVYLHEFFPFSMLLDEFSGETADGIQLGRIGEDKRQFLDPGSLVGGDTSTDRLRAANERI